MRRPRRLAAGVAIACTRRTAALRIWPPGVGVGLYPNLLIAPQSASTFRFRGKSVSAASRLRRVHLTHKRLCARAQHSRGKVARPAVNDAVHCSKLAFRASRHRWQLTPGVRLSSHPRDGPQPEVHYSPGMVGLSGRCRSMGLGRGRKSRTTPAPPAPCLIFLCSCG